jgi:hypothetical protein
MYHVISFVGPPGHGKTHFLTGCTDTGYVATLAPRKYVVPRADNTFFEAWDTPGLARYAEEVERTMRRCDAHLLVLREKLPDMERYERWIRTKPGCWVVVALADAEALRAWAELQRVAFCGVREEEDVWVAAERALEHVVPRMRPA